MKILRKILLWLGGVLVVLIAALAITISYTSSCPTTPAYSGGGETMKAVIYRCYGSADVLEVADVEKPSPGPGQVLVRVRAAGVNPYDWHHMYGSPYLMRLGIGLGAPEDHRMGVDYAGVVEAVGDEVTRFVVGDRVFGGAAGAFAEYVVVRQEGSIARLPNRSTFAEGAGIGIAAITALQALRDSGGLVPGEHVLINGASGGVGSYAVQIAKSMDAKVSGVCSTRNVELVESLGADHVYDYKVEDYTESGEQFDLILDMVANQSLSANRNVMPSEGRHVLVGGKKGNWIAPLIAPLAAMIQSPFVDQQHGMMIARFNQADLDYIGDLIAAGELVTAIDSTYPLEKTADAIRHSESRRARGKIIIEIPE